MNLQHRGRHGNIPRRRQHPSAATPRSRSFGVASAISLVVALPLLVTAMGRMSEQNGEEQTAKAIMDTASRIFPSLTPVAEPSHTPTATRTAASSPEQTTEPKATADAAPTATTAADVTTGSPSDVTPPAQHSVASHSVGPSATPVTSAAVASLQTLRWAPPAGNYVDVHVGGSTEKSPDTVVYLSAGVNYNIVFDAPLTRRTVFKGGHNIKIIGGEVNISSNQVNESYPVDDDRHYVPSNGLDFHEQTGTVYLEGLWVHGAYALDSINAGASSGTTFIIQNSRLESDRVVSGLSNVSDGYYHADGFQSWTGLKGLFMNQVTIVNPYQGGMFGDGALSLPWLTTVLDHVNYRAAPSGGQITKIINFVPRAALQGPLTFQGDSVYYQPASDWSWGSGYKGAFYSDVAVGTDAQARQYGQPNQTNVVNGINNGSGGPGRIYQGLPPNGDYVPAALPGLSYTSP